MGSGKSTLALQIHHNMSSRGVAGLLLTKLDRDGSQVTSRLGVSAPAVDVFPELNIYDLAKSKMPLQFLVCDEAQFYTIDQCDQLAKVVDELGFSWATDNIEKYEKYPILHMAGVTDDLKKTKFYKGEYINIDPIQKLIEDPTYFDYVDTKSSTIKYIEVMRSYIEKTNN